MICELLGVPYADREGFQRRTSRLLDVSAPPEERMAMQRSRAPTWPSWSPAPRPTRARNCSACWYASTATT
ncbi:hypothetical protein ACFQX6_48090 [Streptosporangium lutulentum]